MSDLSKDQVKRIKKNIENDNFKKLKKFVMSEQIPLNAIITKKGEKMLHLAAKEGSSYCLEYLLEAGANAKLVDRKGNLPLHRAIKYVLDDYSRENEKDLVNSLLTYSANCLDDPNFEGVTSRSLLVRLEKLKTSKNDKYVSPFSSSGSVHVEDSEKTEDDEWREKLAEEDGYEYESSFGKFEKFSSSISEPSSETFDSWADRIYQEFYNKKHKHRGVTKKQAKTDEAKKHKPSLKPDIDLSEAHRNYERLKEKKRLSSQRALCDVIFKSESPIDYRNMPFKDMTAEDILGVLLEDCEGEAGSVKKRIREELLRWHPDKFRQKNADRIVEKDAEKVMNHVKNVSQILINYGK